MKHSRSRHSRSKRRSVRRGGDGSNRTHGKPVNLGEVVKTSGGHFKIESPSASHSASHSKSGGRRRRRHGRRGGSVLATAAVPFSLLGLQKAYKKKYTVRKSRRGRRGGSALATAAVPFGLLGLQKIYSKFSGSRK